ncbi:MAG: hypothetical protein ACON3Z_10840 [Bradymonadia bacterium]
MRKLTLVAVAIGFLIAFPFKVGITQAREAQQVTAVPMPVYILMSPLEARSRAFRYRPDSILFGPPTNGPWLTEATLNPHDTVTVRRSNGKPLSGIFAGLGVNGSLVVTETAPKNRAHYVTFDSIESIHVSLPTDYLRGVMVGLFGGASVGILTAAMGDGRNQRVLFLSSLTTGSLLGALFAALSGIDHGYYFAPGRRRLSIAPAQ